MSGGDHFLTSSHLYSAMDRFRGKEVGRASRGKSSRRVSRVLDFDSTASPKSFYGTSRFIRRYLWFCIYLFIFLQTKKRKRLAILAAWRSPTIEYKFSTLNR